MAGVTTTRKKAPPNRRTKAPKAARRVLRGPVELPPGAVSVERRPDGRLALTFAARSELVSESQTPTPKSKRAGAGGTSIMSGKLRYEEFNPDLENDKGLGFYSRQGVYDKMRRTSSQIQRLLWLVKLPILAADPAVEADTRCDDPELAAEIADLCYHDLFEVIPGRQRLREACTMYDFGVSCFEALADVVEVPRARFPNLKGGAAGRPRAGARTGAILFTDFEPRPAKTIYQWAARPEKDTQVETLYQWPPPTDSRPAGWTKLAIPGDWLLRFTHEQEAGNFQGVSLLRPVYKPYVLLDTLETVDAIRHERQNCGIPKITLPQDASDDEVDKAELILNSLASHEKGYLILPFGWGFEWDTSGTGTGTNIAERLDQLKGDIADGAMGRFMSLGDGDTGSYALAETQADRHLDLITVGAGYLEDVINRGSDGWSPIRRIVDWNYGTQDYYPKFCLKNLRSKDDWAQVLPLLDKFVSNKTVPQTYQLALEIVKRMRLPPSVLPTEDEFEEKADAKARIPVVGNPEPTPVEPMPEDEEEEARP